MKLFELFHKPTILFEYDRNKTVQNYGDKIMSAFNKLSNAREEKAISTSVNNSSEEGSDEFTNTIISSILQKLESADPTKNKQYVQWLVRTYSKGDVKLEDVISNGADFLEVYHKAKNKKLLPADLRDINRLNFKQLGDLATDKDILSKIKPKDKAIERGKYKVSFENNEARVIIPEDQAAAMYYGRGTRWCTAATTNNQYHSHADDGDLLIVLPKKAEYDGEKYQLHFASHQFMDQEDSEVSLRTLKERFPDLVENYLLKIEPELKDYIEMVDEELLEKILDGIKEECHSYFTNDLLPELEEEDEGYAEYLNDMRREREEPDSYLFYHYDMKEAFDLFMNILNVDRVLEEYEYDELRSEYPKYTELEMLCARIADNLRHMHDDSGILLYIRDYLKESVIVERDGNVTNKQEFHSRQRH